MDVTLRAYDGKLVKIPLEKKDEYLRCQAIIKKYIEEGKTIDEIKEILKNG